MCWIEPTKKCSNKKLQINPCLQGAHQESIYCWPLSESRGEKELTIKQPFISKKDIIEKNIDSLHKARGYISRFRVVIIFYVSEINTKTWILSACIMENNKLLAMHKTGDISVSQLENHPESCFMA